MLLHEHRKAILSCLICPSVDIIYALQPFVATVVLPFGDQHFSADFHPLVLPRTDYTALITQGFDAQSFECKVLTENPHLLVPNDQQASQKIKNLKLAIRI